MSEIEEFNYGYGKDENGQAVYKYASLAASINAIKNNKELNFTRYIEFNDDMSIFLLDFLNAVKDASNDVPYSKIYGLENMNKVNITCLPWTTFSYFKDAIDFNDKSSKPKVCWGKYCLSENKYFINISLLVNHAFQDGYHIGLFFNNLQQNIYNLKTNKELVKVR